MLSHHLRTKFKEAIIKLNNTSDKRELYRILVIAESVGFRWGLREMYGGGIAISVSDNHDIASDITIDKDVIEVSLNDNYFDERYIPTEVLWYSDETLAEIRNEEDLYQYELPHYRVNEGYVPKD